MFLKGKEQPDKKSRLFARALIDKRSNVYMQSRFVLYARSYRKTVGLSQSKCCEGGPLYV